MACLWAHMMICPMTLPHLPWEAVTHPPAMAHGLPPPANDSNDKAITSQRPRISRALCQGFHINNAENFHNYPEGRYFSHFTGDETEAHRFTKGHPANKWQNRDSNSCLFNSEDRADRPGLDIHQCPETPTKGVRPFHVWCLHDHFLPLQTFDSSRSLPFPITRSQDLCSLPVGTLGISDHKRMKELVSPYVFIPGSSVYLNHSKAQRTRPSSFCRCFLLRGSQHLLSGFPPSVSHQNASIHLRVFFLQIFDATNTY